MNNYLLLLGSNIEEIRQILNLTQEELSAKLGISRPTLVKLEKDPSKLTKTVAFAIFVAVSYEMKSRIREIKTMDVTQFNELEKIPLFMETLKKSSSLSIGAITTTAAIALGPVSGILAGIATASFFKSLKAKEKKEIVWSEEQAQEILHQVHIKLLNDTKKITACFHLTELNLEEFVEAINTGEAASH
ncbi:MAG: helix-turn-helix transcriptional regulator [Solibacillus sp.]